MTRGRSKVTSITESLASPTTVRHLLSLVPRKRRAVVKAVITASTDTHTSRPDQLAQYHHRLAHAVVALEGTDAKQSRASKTADPVKWFHIGGQGSAEQTDPDLGHCIMKYFHYTEITSGWFRGGLALEPHDGGVTFTFLNGLPEGATVSLFLDWSVGIRKAVLSPSSVAVPHKVLRGPSPVNGPDFQWTIVRPNQSLLICIVDDTDGGSIAFAVDCRVSYY